MTSPAPRFPFPMPNGWFALCWSDEVPATSLRTVRAFGRDLVVLRGEDGVARVFDAHCPHLGAHLGHGGKVEGDGVRCPFHGWRFDAAGACVEIPYAKRIPPKARLRAWDAVERNGCVFAWRHAGGAPPSWEIPEIAELRDDAWTAPERREWTIRSCAQEMAENTVDPAHFRYVHGTNAVPETETMEVRGHVLHVVSNNRVATPRGEQRGRIEIETHGFGLGYTRFSGIVDLLVVTTSAPIDAEHTRTRLQFSVRKLPDSDATRGVGRAFIAEIERQFQQDIPIWENKIHLERPLLTDGESGIATLRRWASQFYSAENEAPNTDRSRRSPFPP